MINWKKIIEKNEEELYDAIKNAHDEMFNKEGWHIDVEIDVEGRIYNVEHYGNNQSMTSFKGETFIVATVEGWDLEDEDFESNLCENLENALNYDDEAAKNVGKNAYEYYYNEYVNDDTDDEFEEWFKNEYEHLYEQYKNEYDEAAKDLAMNDNFDVNIYDLYKNI